MRSTRIVIGVAAVVIALMAGQASTQAASSKKEAKKEVIQLQVNALYGAPVFSQADTASTRLDTFPCGTIVTEMEAYQSGQPYYHVKNAANGVEGWVNGWLMIPDLTPTPCVQETQFDWQYGVPVIDGWVPPASISVSQTASVASPEPAPATNNGSIEGIICQAAATYGQDCGAMIAVAICESGLDPNNVTPPYSASGLFQFLPGTWASTPYASSSVFDPWANANAAAWMWSVGRRGEWVC